MPKRNSRHLTDSIVDRLNLPAKRYELWDSGQPGLSLRVAPTGSRVWNVYYRFNNKAQRMLLGPWPSLKIKDARQRAFSIREQAQSGINPKAAKAEAKAREQNVRSFAQLAELYIKDQCPRLKDGKRVDATIRNHLLPSWKDRRIDSLKRRDARQITRGLIDAGSPYAARNAHAAIKRIFNWALAELDQEELGFDVSPFANLGSPIEVENRSRVLRDHEIKVLWPILIKTGAPFGAFVQTLLLTGQRRVEVAQMRWHEIDVERRLWTIPAARSKNGKPHIVPLSPMAFGILDNLARYDGKLDDGTAADFVFTTTSGQRPIGAFSLFKSELDAAAKAAHKKDPKSVPAIEPWRLHDLRRTCRTGMARLGVPEPIAEAVINHSRPSLIRTYDVHEYQEEKRAGLEKWASELRNIVEDPPKNLVQLELLA